MKSKQISIWYSYPCCGFLVFFCNTGIRTLALIDPLKVNEERSFLFTNEQHGSKSTCHKTLIKAGTYTVRKEEGETLNDMPTYVFEASVMLPAPSGRCRRLVTKCFPTLAKNQLKLNLGAAYCYGGEMALLEGIT